MNRLTLIALAVATASLAACVAFSVAAPQVLRYAMQPVAQQNAQQQVDAVRSLAEMDSWAAVLQAASDAAFGMADDIENAASAVEEFPTRILMPKGTVGMVDMPGLGGSEN